MDITSRSRRSLARRALPAALLACLLLGLGATTATADHSDTTIFDPHGSTLLYRSNADRSGELDQLQALGANTVRVPVNWAYCGPGASSRTKPQGFDASDPTAYPRGTLSILDSTIKWI